MSSEAYEAQVRLLLRVLPELGRQDALALKGGTALNLFVQDLPRLSVDIDLAYLGTEGRDEALAQVHAALLALAARLERLGLRASPSLLKGTAFAVKLAVADGATQVKVEVNPVIRGSVYPPERRITAPTVQARFGFAEVLSLSEPDLYAGKLVAALDRQHPRDLFDVHLFLRQGRFTRDVLAAFLVYLVSHPRPPHELLRPHLKDVRREFDQAFAGMTVEAVPLADLEAARADLLTALHNDLTADDRAFLLSVARGEPEWGRLPLAGVAELPAVRWKLHNVARMGPAKRSAAAAALEAALAP